MFILRERIHVGWVLLQVFVCTLVVARPLTLGAQGQHDHPPQDTEAYIRLLEDPSREEWQQPDQVVYSLDLRPEDEVAEVGAGSGYFTIRLAKALGPSGRVYAVDVDKKMLDHIERRAEREKLENIQTILADGNDPRLGSESVDVIFICDTLHHIQNRKQYYPLLLRALRQGGRLVIVDFYKTKMPVGPPLDMRIEKKSCIKEAEAAGFRLSREFLFLKYQYFLIFEPKD